MKDFDYDDIVCFNKYSAYGGKFCGKIGIIKRISGSLYGVEIEGITNKNSRDGLFWFTKCEITLSSRNNWKKENKEEQFMDTNYKPVIINFISGSNIDTPYTYAAYEDYAKGDYVVVHTGHHGFAVAQVIAVENVEGNVQYGREIVCKIDITAYNDRKARAKRKAELKGRMEAKAKELQEMAIFEMLAKEDAELTEMLKEFKELG